MKTTTLAIVAATAALERLLRDPPPKEPPNTYGLPSGEPIKKTLKQWFKIQAKGILGTLPKIGADLSGTFPSLADYNDPMASAMTPILSAYWQESGEKVRERVGLDPAEWEVTDKHLEAKIQGAAFSFCDSTNATTSMFLDAALEKLRSEFVAGLVDQGETLGELAKRVQSVFDQAEDWRAFRIARTEAARAVHAAQLQSAIDCGVVAGLEWLVSGDACPVCQQIAAEVRQVKLGQEFATIGENAAYKYIRHPPAHPGCMCTALEVLKPDYGGPEDPEWGKPLDQPDPPEDYKPPGGAPKPAPEKLTIPLVPPAPKKPQPAPKPKPAPVPTAPPPPPPPPTPREFPADPDADVEVVRRLGGSTGAELVRDKATGKLFVRKRGANPGHLREEHAADEIYRSLGVPVPKAKLFETATGPVKLAEFHEGTTLEELRAKDPKAAARAEAELRKHFAADALLGNWDVVGLKSDNILVTKAGEVLRIDNGGSLRYRAQGGKKGGQWTTNVAELLSLRSHQVNPSAARVFGPIADADVADQVAELVKRRKEILAAAPADLKADLGKRLDWLADPANLPGAKAAPPPSAAGWVPTPEADLRDFKDFAAAKSWAMKTFGATGKALTPAEKEALLDYSGSMYGAFNSALRTGKALDARQQKTKAGLDQALHRQKLAEGIKVWRGLNLKAAGVDRAKLVPGMDIVDVGFTSTTIDTGKSFPGDKLEIRLPKGTPCFYLNAAKASKFSHEAEVLLPAEVNRFRVVEVRADKIIVEAILP